MSGTVKTTSRSAIMAGLLAMSTLYATTQAGAASLGHLTGMTTGPRTSPAIQVPTGRLHGHDGPKQAPPYAYDQSGHVRHIHHYDKNWTPDGTMTAATTDLKPR